MSKFWDNLKKDKNDMDKCIFLKRMEYGHLCEKGFPTVYTRTSNDKFEPYCEDCTRKTVLC